MTVLPEKTKISHFEDEFNAKTIKRRRDLRGRKFLGSVALQVHKKTSTVYRLAYIETFPSKRNWGMASLALKFLCDLADIHQIQLELCPVQLEENGLNLLDLTRWYQRFGFRRIGMQDEMIRQPKRGWVNR